MSLISELKRRNVLRVAAAYVVTAWLIIQVVETIFPIYGLSDNAIRYVITGLAVGFIPALILSWVFEVTPEGILRDSEIDQATARSGTRTLDRIIMVVLALGLGYFAFDKFVLSESREAEIAETAREQGRSEAIIDGYGSRSIAVLPFVDMSPDGDQEYMSDGIAEELLNLLAKVPDLRVISRSSAFAFKGKDISIPDVARQLNAAYVLEGSVRKAGNQIRITAQLIDGGTDTHQWSETYDRKLENIFDIQDEIAAQVVEELKATLLGDGPRSVRVNEEVYEMVLQARYLWYRRAPGDEERVLEMLQRATEMDADYAPAWSGLSVAYAVAVQRERMDPDDGMAAAQRAAEKAVALDPDFSEGHVRLGQALARQKNRPGMIAAYERAYEIDPNNPLVLGVLGMQAGRQGRIDRVVELMDRAAAVDPLGSIWPGNKGHWLMRMRRLDEAEAAGRRALSLNGNVESFNNGYIDILILKGEYDAALELLAGMPKKEINLTRLAVAHYGVGNVEKSQALIDGMISEAHPYAYMGVAMTYAARGDNDRAFEWLAKAKGVPPWNTVYDGYLRTMVDDPRWKPYVDSLDWPWEYEY